MHIIKYNVLFAVGWGANAPAQGFGDQSSVKFQILNLVRSIRTVTRSEYIYISVFCLIHTRLINWVQGTRFSIPKQKEK